MAAVAMDTCQAVKLPALQLPAKSVYEGRFNDRAPAIQTAGKLTAASGDTVQHCMETPPEPLEPDIVRRFRATVSPASGKATVFYGRSRDPQQEWAKMMTHGGKRATFDSISPMLNPDPISAFSQQAKLRSERIYESTSRKPLGRTYLAGLTNLPRGLDPDTHAFGAAIIRSGNAGELISPAKSAIQVYAESEVGRPLYRRSHTALWPSEQHRRGYSTDHYSPTATFGVHTPHANDGRHARTSLRWTVDELAATATPVVGKRVDVFRERTQPQLGVVHDPIADTLNVEPGHTFGVLSKPEAYGVGDLIHYRAPDRCLHGSEQMRGVLSMIRHQLKAANYHNFHDLLAAFLFYDKNCCGRISVDDLRAVCSRFELPTDPLLMAELLAYCDANGDGLIDYNEFANFLNWKRQMPSGLLVPACGDREEKRGEELKTEFITKQVDGIVGDHRLSSEMINAVVGPDAIPTTAYRTYGVPSIRTDKPAPRLRRVCDRTNYGDGSDAHGLVNPSIYSNLGAYEKDFLMARPLAEIRDVFKNIGVKMDDDVFCRVYNAAAERHPDGLVSVETFRNVLDEIQATMLGKSNVL